MTQPPSAHLSAMLGTSIRVKVVDVGANPINGAPPYASLLAAGEADIVGFEPNPDALAALDAVKGPQETYLPFAVGDGRRHTLHLCRSSGMSSLLEPDPDILDLYHGFPDWGRVTSTVAIDTVRLDDLPETVGMDLLKIDIQGGELMVFENATSRLRDALVIQTEVEFLPLYRNQPLFSDVDRFLRSQGFVLHRFIDMNSRVLKPMVLDDDIYASLSQHLFADAVFVKDFTRLNRLGDDKLLRMAAILHGCYGSWDLVLKLVGEHDRRTGGSFGHRYVEALRSQHVPRQQAA